MSLIKCPECHSDISEQALNCPKCGHPLRNTAISQNNKTVRKTSPLTWILFVALLITLAIIVENNVKNRSTNSPSKIFSSYFPTQHTTSIVQGSIIAKSLKCRSYNFSTKSDSYNNKISGHFQASGGSGNDIKVYVMTEDNYTNFLNGHTCATYFETGQITVSDIYANLPSGFHNFVLVFDNSFSVYTDKEINAIINLTSTY
jgi:hypothetical protein